MKYNPFRPNNMVGPGMFVGRTDELDTIEQCLFQTKHGNPQHFLTEGERGIGKSSLLFLTEHIAKGTVRSVDGTHHRFLAVSVDMGGVSTQMDIVKTIGRELRSAIGTLDALKQSAKNVWEFLSKWEVMGVRFHGEDQADSEDVTNDLVDSVINLLVSGHQEIDGIFVIIDEADAPPVSAGLGIFLKLFTERLTKRDCNNVLFGLAGLPTTIPKLRESHPSSPRILEVLKLDPLDPAERKQVVLSGLRVANGKNDAETTITEEAISAIADLSEGYPHFIQQFSYFAFSEDRDNVIDTEDVMRGAYKDNGALMQLGHKYFSEMYRAKISSNDYRRVLDSMAAHGDAWVARKDIINECGVSETSVTNALAALKERNIILSDETRRGFYRLPTKSFAAWINAIRSVEAQKEGSTPDLFGSGG